ncbi:MAG: alpha/beta hydrolase, partial [Chloroflexi bacterium]|nr:alpha/beta hydrolase [Chloroflexota bacterium]
QMSNELHVTEKNPPVFLFHTADDPVVPVSHSLRFAEACLAKGVLVEMHIYESGRHGVGLATDLPKLASWTGLLMDWLSGWE